MKESSVRTWRNKYLEELQTRNKEGRKMVVKELPNKKKGQPLMLGENSCKLTLLRCAIWDWF